MSDALGNGIGWLYFELKDNPLRIYRFNNQQWTEWQSNYTAFITHYASIAKELGDQKVKMFSLGFELNYAAVSQTKYFSDFIGIL